MRSSTSKFDERGHDSLVRDVEELNLQLADLGIEAEGLSRALVNQQVSTNSAISTAVAAHEAKANPHPQYLLSSAYSPYTPSFTGVSARCSVSVPTAYATVNFNAQEYDPLSLLAAGVFTAPSAGVYYIGVTGYYTAGQGTAGTLMDYGGQWLLNGASFPAMAPGIAARGYSPNVSFHIIEPFASAGAALLSAGDTVEYQNFYVIFSGSVVSVSAAARLTIFKIA